MAEFKAFFERMRCTEQLKHIQSYPVVAIIAPMGYGKSTALRAYLSNKPSIWVSCQEGSSLENLFWTAAGLEDTEDRFNALRTLENGTIIVFEDYHYLAMQETAEAFLRDLLLILRDRCHLVLVSRRDAGITQDPELLLHGTLYRIEPEDFLLEPWEIKNWSQLCGLTLNSDEINQLVTVTEGWAALVYLMMLEYSRSGCLLLKNEHAFMDLIYAPLSENCKKILWYLAEAVDFSEIDAEFLWGSGDGQSLIRNLRSEGVPIRRIENRWHLHNVFAAYVQSQRKQLNETNQASIFRRLGRWYQRCGKEQQATEAYEAAGDWDQLMTMIEEDAGKKMSFSNAERVTRLMVLCPKDVLSRHPGALFYYARQIATLGQPQLVHRWRPSDAGLAAEVDLQAAYPDLEQMTRCCRVAREHRESLLPTWREPFTRGALSLLNAYHKGHGPVESSLKYFEEFSNLYVPLSDGHGAGALEVAQAEHSFLQGLTEYAEIRANRALILAREARQDSVQIASLFLLARCAYFRKDRELLREYLTQITEKAAGQPMLEQTAEMARTWFQALQGSVEACKFWLQNGNVALLELMPSARIDYYIVSALVMLKQRKWAQLIAYSDQWLNSMEPWFSNLTALYLRLYQAAAYTALEMPEKGQISINEAFHLAETTGWCMPFVELWDELESWQDKIQQNLLGTEKWHKLADRCTTYNQFVLPKLSPRENEIAHMLCAGASNSKIAAQLGISINTVKTMIRHINAKLQTTDRASLKRYISQL